jgi:hypothetical protein
MRCRSPHGRSRYYLGPDGLGIDSEWLDVEFDGHGRVVRLDVVQT